MQPVDTGVPIARSHDGGEYLLRLGDSTRPWVGNFDVLLPDSSPRPGLLPRIVLGLVPDSLLRAVVGRQLVNKISSVAPEGEVGVERGALASAVVVLAFQETGRISGVVASGRLKRLQWDVRRTPRTVGRHFE